jgi:hypothetical protein
VSDLIEKVLLEKEIKPRMNADERRSDS